MFEALSNRRVSPATNSVLPVTTSSDNVAIAGPGSVLELRNDSTTTLFWKVGTTAPTAVSGGTAKAADTGSAPMLGGEVLSIACPADGTLYVAAITAAGTALLRISRGG